jgi:hypothetical protein
MFYWIYDIPPLLVISLFSVVFVGVCWLGIILLRPFAKSWFHEQPNLNEILGNFLHYFGVIYGLLLGLLAIATYQDHSDVQKAVAGEASSLAALYRDVTAYPEPSRTKLQDLLRGYTRSVIDDAWPLQRKGIVPVDGVAAFQEQLVLFEPQTKGQEALHETALRQFNTFYEHRRTRLYSIYSGIPAILWYTVAVGALINMLLIWLFDLRLHAHWLLGGLISFYLATIISVIALLDHPLRGKLGVSPEAFELVYDQLMKH